MVLFFGRWHSSWDWFEQQQKNGMSLFFAVTRFEAHLHLQSQRKNRRWLEAPRAACSLAAYLRHRGPKPGSSQEADRRAKDVWQGSGCNGST